MKETDTCDVEGCDEPRSVLYANNESILSDAYREWWVCELHRGPARRRWMAELDAFKNRKSG